MIHIDLPVDVSPFHSDEEIEAVLREAVAKVSFPDNARVSANIGFIPDPRQEMQVLRVQDGFYEEPEPLVVVTPPTSE